MKYTPLTFKIASQADEFEQINRLNYQTFVEEIPQHPSNPDGLRCDKFHEENIYVIALRGDHLVGMIAVRDRRPFSLDGKLPHLDSYLPAACCPCEIRLLAIPRHERKGMILRGLITLLGQHCWQAGYDLALISGTVRQKKLYQHLGFIPFGPLVGMPGAKYQPMYLPLATFFEERGSMIFGPHRLQLQPQTTSRERTRAEPVNLLPGPVNISPVVRAAFAAAPISHRAPAFIEELQQTQQALCTLTQAPAAQIMVGTGTLANDIIAGQLSLQAGHGLILSNGEFGNRLLDHAARLGLSYTALRTTWGAVFERQLIEEALEAHAARWLWAVHCETSTGVVQDLDMLKAICAAREIRLCLDCISSIGTMALDLGSVSLASASSGKGIGAYPGLGIVFHDHAIVPAPQQLPRYLDLGLYATSNGTPFTHSSNLLAALGAAVQSLDNRRCSQKARCARWLRAQLRRAGLEIVAPEVQASPAVTTLALPPEVRSEEVGLRLENEGYWLSYRSDYLLERNWIQICTMAGCSMEQIAPLPHLLRRTCFVDG